MAQLRIFCATTFFIYLTLIFLVTLVASKPSGLSLELISADSPDHPFYLGNISDQEKINHMIESSDARAIRNKSIFVNPDGLQILIYKYLVNYAVQLYIGTPRKQQTLLLDTGNSLIWTQCQPCKPCFNQSDPIFIPSQSSTFRRLPTSNRLCGSGVYRIANNECTYSLRYFGGSSTSGVLSVETFTFPRGRTLTPIQNIVFGCSNKNVKFAFSSNGRISGILGMSTAPESLVYQLSTISNRRFSYCLAYSRPPAIGNGVLRFGDDVPNTPNLRRTSLVGQNISHNYYLNLLDISVSGHRIGFPEGTFALQRNGAGGFEIDSGSPITFLNRGPYQTVMNEFRSHFLRFGLERVNNTGTELDLCYRRRPNFRQYAGMIFHLRGADLVVEPENMYIQDSQGGFFCVALRAINGVNLLGAWQQQNIRFVYDLDAQELRFAPADCSADRFVKYEMY